MAWTRKAYKGCKVYVAVDDAGAPALNDQGFAQFRYRPDDDRTYSAQPDRIQDLSDEPVSPEPSPDTVVVYAVGISEGNPGPAGIGIVLLFQEHRKEIARGLGHRSETFAALVAVKTGLESLKTRDRPVLVRVASAGCHELLSRSGKPDANVDLVKEVRSLMRGFRRVDVVLDSGEGETGTDLVRAGELARGAVGATAPS